jgi:hypothetical protein
VKTQRSLEALIEVALARCLSAYQEGQPFHRAIEAGRRVLDGAVDQIPGSDDGRSPNSLFAGTGRLTK